MRTIILGLDSFDPIIFERLLENGKMPHLAQFVARDQYRHFTVSDPPQSEVSWTSIATGLNPGGHGLFDFVHRNPQNYSLHVSLLPTKKGIGGFRFTQPFNAKSVFDKVASDGYPATALWWPATFPARVQSPVRTIPGLGTPDLLGRLGVGMFYTTATGKDSHGNKIPVQKLSKSSKGTYQGSFVGPARNKSGKIESIELAFEISLPGKDSAELKFEKERFELKIGEWTPIIEVNFKMGLFFSVRAITRLILCSIGPDIELYALPLQIHPLKTAWNYGTPKNFIKSVWQETGPYLTLGWPQDTTALEEDRITDRQFLQLCKLIFEERKRTFLQQVDEFQEGLLACVFDTLDRIQHMFLKQRPDVVEDWYISLDALVGDVEQRLKKSGFWNKTKLIVMSDHGFGRFDYKVHLNRWLEENGYLTAKNNSTSREFSEIDWGQSKVYAIGLNSLFLNLEGREGRGIVKPGDVDNLLDEISIKLKQWEGFEDKQIVDQVLKRKEAFDGPLAEYGPDLLVGYAQGYRASQETGLGNWHSNSFEKNNDHWASDHCMYAAAVPGVIFCNHGIFNNFTNPSYRDIPAIAIGANPDDSGSAPPPISSDDEDEAAVQERLRSLGYL